MSTNGSVQKEPVDFLFFFLAYRIRRILTTGTLVKNQVEERRRRTSEGIQSLRTKRSTNETKQIIIKKAKENLP